MTDYCYNLQANIKRQIDFAGCKQLQSRQWQYFRQIIVDSINIYTAEIS